jgi:hypothetical protein
MSLPTEYERYGHSTVGIEPVEGTDFSIGFRGRGKNPKKRYAVLLKPDNQSWQTLGTVSIHNGRNTFQVWCHTESWGESLRMEGIQTLERATELLVNFGKVIL